MEDVKLDNERESHWRIVFEDNDGGWIIRNRFYMPRRGMYR